MICGNCQREIADYSRYCYFCGKHQASAFTGSPTQRLHRSVTDRKLEGVCGGIAEYLQTDSTIVRLVWAAVTICTGIVPGAVMYLIAWIIIPEMAVVVQPAAPASSAPETPHA